MSTIRAMMESALEGGAGAPFRVVFWDSGERAFGEGPPAFLVRFRSEQACARVLSEPSLGLGEGYMDGKIEIEGDLVKCLELSQVRGIARREAAAGSKLRRLFMALWNPNTLNGSRRNISRHYDLGNDFYRLWLDPHLQYTCAFFTDPGQSLEAAQTAKMDLVCRKLRLRAGQTLLETGCGWGGFAIFAAKRYGARVTAYNISARQIAYARQWAATEGLADRVEFVHDDYRNARGEFDAFASIGMVEHVGRRHYEDLCEVITRTLKPEGAGLLHFIGKNRPERLNPWLTKYIFPGAYTPALQEMLPAMGRCDLVTCDVENLRLHYARTLERWLANFEQQVGAVAAMFDERFVRMWRFYLAAAVAAFKTGALQLYQVLFTNGPTADLALTREHQNPSLSEPPEIATWNASMRLS
jgi:cyclopropane-fatty-acyl-phospholipid synthase